MPVKKTARKSATRATKKKRAAEARTKAANEALYGGVDVPVTLLDGSKDTIKVSHITIGEHTEGFLHVVENTLACAAYCTGLSEEDLKQLAPNSLLDLAEKAVDLNFTVAVREIERQIKLKRVLMNLATQTIQPPASPSA